MESIENFHFDLNCDFFLGGGGILGYEVKRQYGHIFIYYVKSNVGGNT